MSLDYSKVRYKNRDYAVLHIKYKDGMIPSIIDWEDLKWIQNLNKQWKCNKSGIVYCLHTYNGLTKEVYLHEIIMASKEENKRKQKRPILHINMIGLDNRKLNLVYDTQDKPSNRNFKKKRRTISLPEESGIKPDEIPTYIWYMKPDDTHGERFMVEIGDINWKTTSSKNFSLKYKLEEAKSFLKELKKERPEIFENYSMNGDYTKDGKILLNSFYSIIHRAGYKHITRYLPTNNTDKLLKIKDKNIDISLDTDKRRRVLNNIPVELGVTTNNLPQYCYYKPSNDIHGDYFYIENHPYLKEQGLNYWKTSSSKNISPQAKYDELLDFIEEYLTGD